MLTRSQLEVMGFNKGSQLEQATTQAGEKRYNLNFSKITKKWSSKPINKKEDRSYLHRMVNETINCAPEDRSSHLI